MALEKQGRDSGKLSGRIWKNEAMVLTQKWNSRAKYLDFNKIKNRFGILETVRRN